MFSTHQKKRPAASLHEPKPHKKRPARKPFDLTKFQQEMFGDFYKSRQIYHMRIMESIRALAKHIMKSPACKELNGDDISEILIHFILPKTGRFFDLESPFIDNQIKLAQVKADIKLLVNTQPYDVTSRTSRLLSILKTDARHSMLSQIAEDKTGDRYTYFLDSINTVNEIIANLVDNSFDEYIPDFLCISRLLFRKEMIYPHLDNLEGVLQYRAAYEEDKSNLNVREDGKLTLALSAENIFKRNRLLSSALYEWARQNGFQSSAKILRNLSSKQFSSLLAQMSLLKDSAIAVGTTTHGAWSHALQWYVVFEHQKTTRFLQHQPMELYTRAQPAWNTLFDVISPFDFTSPDSFTELLCSREAQIRWPLLSGSIIRIQAKMQSPHFDYDKYLKEKYEKEYDQGYITRPF